MTRKNYIAAAVIVAAALGSGALVITAVGSYRALTRDTKPARVVKTGEAERGVVAAEHVRARGGPNS
jgi:hypothetical protein